MLFYFFHAYPRCDQRFSTYSLLISLYRGLTNKPVNFPEKGEKKSGLWRLILCSVVRRRVDGELLLSGGLMAMRFEKKKKGFFTGFFGRFFTLPDHQRSLERVSYLILFRTRHDSPFLFFHSPLS